MDAKSDVKKVLLSPLKPTNLYREEVQMWKLNINEVTKMWIEIQTNCLLEEIDHMYIIFSTIFFLSCNLKACLMADLKVTFVMLTYASFM